MNKTIQKDKILLCGKRPKQYDSFLEISIKDHCIIANDLIIIIKLDSCIISRHLFNMEEVMPLEMAKNNFKANIIKMVLFHKRNTTSFYDTDTSLGKMTLILQQFVITKQYFDQQLNHHSINQNFIKQRNQLLSSNKIVGPLIYEQEIVKIRQNMFICLTLTQPISIITRTQLNNLKSYKIFQILVLSGYKISRTAFQYQDECYNFQNTFKTMSSSHILLDFTRIHQLYHNQKRKSSVGQFQMFKKQLCSLMEPSKIGRLNNILFIKQKAIQFNLEVIRNAKSWFDLAMMFNLLGEEKVQVTNEKRTKLFKINKLQGCINFQYQNEKYQNFNFDEGYRIDGFAEISYERQKKQFFEEKTTYIIEKERYQIVRKSHNNNQCWIKLNVQYSDLLIVTELISKAEFINFLIGYFKHIEPILHLIKFYSQQNALNLQFFNKNNKVKSILIKFNNKYIVKDQQISMIIEKTKLKNTILCLQNMKITDSFLFFLANSDKLQNISQFNISQCQLLTDIGIQSLLASPFCKYLKILKMSTLPMVDLTVVKFKKQLKQLQINSCQQYQQLYFQDWKIQKLEALGMIIDLHLPLSLKILSINSQVPVQNLKLLRNLQLSYLKIKLVQNKKNITNFFNSLYIKQNPFKIFAQGNSKNFLKTLDISGSTIKIKQFRPILMLQLMQNFICQDIERDKFQECVLPQHLMNLSFRRSKITLTQLVQLTQKTNIIIKLNIQKTLIDDLQLEQYIKSKRYINSLEIQEEQFCTSLIQKKSGIDTVVMNVKKLLRDQHQYLLNRLLFIQTDVCKQMNFTCLPKHQSILISKIYRFFKFYEIKLEKLTNKLNLNINSIPLWKHILYQKKQQSSQLFTLINQQNQTKTKLPLSYLVNQTATNKQQINLNLFNICLHRCINHHPNSLIQVCIKSNRIIGKEVIDILYKYSQNKLKSIDFRDCIFTFQEVKKYLYDFPILQSVNEGEYEIAISEEDNCEYSLQIILKFFMKLRQKQKIKLTIIAKQIKQHQLYYSVLFQIIHQFSNNIISLNISFTNVELEHSQLFWQQIFKLQNLEAFCLSYFNNDVQQEHYSSLLSQFQNINKFKLVYLDLATNISHFIPTYLQFKSIKKLRFNFANLPITETALNKWLKNLHSLTHIEIQVGNCQMLTSLSKISDALQKIQFLTHLTLDIQNCPLKQQQIFQLIYCLQKNKELEKLILNICNINVSLIELVKFCQQLQKHNKFCYIIIYALQSKKQIYTRQSNQLISKGIQIIYNTL